jgi:hypothetical protein
MRSPPRDTKRPFKEVPPILVIWGTYDLGKPRNRILLQGLRGAGAQVIECHFDVWHGVEDKSLLKGLMPKLRVLARWLAAYPRLLLRYLRLPAHDAVVIGYLGQLDVIVLWPFAKLRGAPIIWDVLMSLHVSIIEGGRLLAPRHLAARALFA